MCFGKIKVNYLLVCVVYKWSNLNVFFHREKAYTIMVRNSLGVCAAMSVILMDLAQMLLQHVLHV